MLVTKCDICKKEVEKAVFTSVGSSFLSNNQSFCLKCGHPVLNFLKKINKKNEKQKRK